ncbi:hypothetical protein FC697_20785 [Bacillus wiedmannii]|uniref:hypothetical protein n=1 Tax=Bacillus wiedmannii TaxID=1890302 RepID=UPI0010BDB4F7|nr:hypothetical protein [Bacillus wiedmannii]TKH18984.1 hypothetical protein FC697_20785 [Bacillus wiedmannii]
MEIALEKATENDAAVLFQMQIDSFSPFLIEKMFPKARSFELATILEEERNCFLYEKMGYKRTEVIKKLNDKTTLIYYKKER